MTDNFTYAVDRMTEDRLMSQFVVRRDGLRWRIYENGSDGICRPIHPIAGRFWRWITAARLASEFNRVRHDGASANPS